MAIYQLHKSQFIPADLQEVWDFISSPKNLKKITPEYMGFDITTENLPDQMYEGMIIAYKVSPLLDIKTTWVTEITHIGENKFFIDEQRVGPYKIWHHEHRLIEEKAGVTMTDLVTYQPPFGILGQMARSLFIKQKLEEIFDFREKKVIEIFGS